MSRTTADIELGQVLGKFAAGGGVRPDAYRSGVDARLRENADVRQDRSLNSQLATDELQREKLRRELAQEDARKAMTAEDVIRQFGGMQDTPRDAMEEILMATGNPDYVPSGMASPQQLSQARNALSTKAIYDVAGKDINQVVASRGGLQEQAILDALTSKVDATDPGAVAEVMAAMRGAPSPSATINARTTGGRGSALMQFLDRATAPVEAGGWGWDETRAMAVWNKQGNTEADYERYRRALTASPMRYSPEEINDQLKAYRYEKGMPPLMEEGAVPPPPGDLVDMVTKQLGGAPTGGPPVPVVKRYQ